MTSRREFLRTGTFLAAGAALVSTISCTNKRQENNTSSAVKKESLDKEIGIQIHSVRPQLEEDFEATMKKIADIGFKLIEGYGLGIDGLFLERITPSEYKKVVHDLGMRFVSTHTRLFNPDEARIILDSSLGAGVKYALIPAVPEEFRESADTYREFANNLNQIGEVFADSGVRFGFHNHEYEFEQKDGEIPFEILLNETDPSLVTFQLDLYWATLGGADPMDLINKYPGRFSSFHVKDADENLGRETVGKGIIDFERILNAQKQAGLEYYFVEDFRPGDDPFKHLKESFDYLNASDFG